MIARISKAVATVRKARRVKKIGKLRGAVNRAQSSELARGYSRKGTDAEVLENYLRAEKKFKGPKGMAKVRRNFTTKKVEEAQALKKSILRVAGAGVVGGAIGSVAGGIIGDKVNAAVDKKRKRDKRKKEGN